MNMKTMIASIVLLSASPALADNDQFFYSDVQNTPFSVSGILGDKSANLNPACYADISYQDGSRFQLIRDLADGELWMLVRNVNWQIPDQPGSVNILQANFHQGQNIYPMTFQYKVMNKNTIAIQNIIKDGSFLPYFMKSSKMIFIMPDNIENIQITLDGSRKALEDVARCILTARDKNLWLDTTPTVKEP